METINNIQAIPNQEFTVTINDYEYGFHFYWCDGFMGYDLTIDDETVVQGFKMVYAQPLIPYRYQEKDGNFILTSNGTDPYYENFNDTEFLRYLTQDESDAWRDMLETGEYDG